MVDSVTLETAKVVIDACEQKATDIGTPMVVAVTNAEGNLVAQHRMDSALLASLDISKNKAYTAAAVKLPTHELAEATQPGESLYGLQNTDQGRMVIFGGGFPLTHGGEIVGALGVSGGSVEEDMDVAQAGLDAFENIQ
ncbi:GlcG/HbpS family heme-binding protein [Haloferax sp. DFSO60]|uniref:GlcG/HbpS family heme-binding protein n=1 Tax=Haloferax sp. DFSO60 TaxID=3388652 RepID=UPI00397BD4DD